MQNLSTLLKQLSLDALLLLGRAHTALERDALPAAPEGLSKEAKRASHTRLYAWFLQQSRHHRAERSRPTQRPISPTRWARG